MMTCDMCAVGVTEGFEVKVGLHQGSALSPCLFAMVMDRMRDEIREVGRLSIVGTFPTMLVLICSRAY